MSPREACLAIYRASLEACHAGRLTATALAGDDPVPPGAPLRIAALGKASVEMAEAALDRYGDVPALAVAPRGRTSRRVRVVQGSHPIPDAASLSAGEALLRFCAASRPGEFVLGLVSGGASALAEAVAPGVGEDLKAWNRRMLEAGATIRELNAVRRRLSVLKGGGLARAASRATGAVLVLSDVEGDDPAVVGSGPFVAAPSDPDPEAIAKRLGLPSLPSRTPGETPTWPHRIVGSSRDLLRVAEAAALRVGLEPRVEPVFLTGEARDLGRWLAARAMELEPGECVVATGEPTVTVRGPGVGGRCGELAAGALLSWAGAPFTLLAAGSDGRDGPSGLAGILAGPTTPLDGLERALAASDTGTWAQRAGVGLPAFHSGTNVNDLYLVIRPA